MLSNQEEFSLKCFKNLLSISVMKRNIAHLTLIIIRVFPGSHVNLCRMSRLRGDTDHEHSF